MLNHIDLMAALTADYLNVYVIYPKKDVAEIIKLKGYVAHGINDPTQSIQYSKLISSYTEGRVHPEDREFLLEALLPDVLLESFAGERVQLEYNYRVIEEDGSIHQYSARYSRISEPEEELRLVAAFRNTDFIADIGREKHAEGIRSAYDALSAIFFSMHRVNIQENTFSVIKTTPSIDNLVIPGSDNYDINAERVIRGLSLKWSIDDALSFIDRTTLPARMEGKRHIYTEFLSYSSELCRIHFFRAGDDEKGNLCHVIFAVEKMEDMKRNAVINALARDFNNVFLIDLENGFSRMLKMTSNVNMDIYEKHNQKFIYERICNYFIAELVHPEDREVFRKKISLSHLREHFLDNEVLTGSFRTQKDGIEHHFRYTYYRLENLNSVVAGFRNIDDIIAKLEAEKERQREIELTRQRERDEQLEIFNTLSKNYQNVYLVDMDSEKIRALKLGAEYEEILKTGGALEFPLDDFRKYWIDNVVYLDDREEVRKAFETKNVENILDTQGEMSGYNRSLINGELHHFQYFMSRVNLPGLKAILAYQNVDKIVEEHHAQEKRERELEEARLKELRKHAEVVASLSTMYSTIFNAELITHRYEVLTSVPLMKKVAGTVGDFDEIKENIISAFIAPEMHDDMREFLNLDTLQERLKNVSTVSTEYKSPENDWFEGRFIVKSRGGNGEVCEVLYVGRNITDEKMREFEQQERLSNALAAAQQANRAKTTFLNSMSHDIRTPMNAIIGFTALAQAHMDDHEQVQEYLAKISTSSSHLLNLINDILDMSRIESGTVKLDERPIHIPDLMHDMRTMVHGLAVEKKQNLYIDTQDVIHEDIITDRLRLNQVMINIIGNAIKYTPAGGDIFIRLLEKPATRANYATYEFSVRDTGMGMSAEFLEHIFETFTRERNSTVSGVQGTGLGMAITKNIIDMMGGDIKVESEEGKGSLFTVTLEVRLAGEAVNKEPIPELLGARVLIVDDDLNTCRSVSRMLRDINMRPDWTASGREAILRVQDAVESKDEYKVYIIDYLMPDMNGIETVRRIRRHIKEDVPIIVLTAYDWMDFEQEAKEAGVTAFVPKPLFMSELLMALSQKDNKESSKQAEARHYDYKGRHVLLVEDNDLNREIAAAILENAGMKVDFAVDGAQAVDIMYETDEDKYDLIFMDIQMPKMDGYTATHEIRTFSNNKKANIPIVAMTANAFEEDKIKSFEAGMNGHIVKPINMEEIAKVLDDIFV